MENNKFYSSLIAIVAIVAIVSLVVLVQGGKRNPMNYEKFTSMNKANYGGDAIWKPKMSSKKIHFEMVNNTGNFTNNSYYNGTNSTYYNGTIIGNFTNTTYTKLEGKIKNY